MESSSCLPSPVFQQATTLNFKLHLPFCPHEWGWGALEVAAPWGQAEHRQGKGEGGEAMH